jgi:hypothetical protein
MHLPKFLLAIDFDFTMTMDEHLTKSWGDRLSKKLIKLRSMFPLEIFILSVANIQHIFQTIVVSKSNELLYTVTTMPIITYEGDNLFLISHDRGETRKEREEMIRKIVPTKYIGTVDPIVAYKKTHYLLRRSKEENIPHSHVFFLDDNHLNIHFARYHGFHTFLVDNQVKEKNIFAQLDKVKDMLKHVKK